MGAWIPKGTSSMINQRTRLRNNNARKILGKRNEMLSEAELQDLIGSLYSIAEIIADNVSNSGSKKTTKGLELGVEGAQNG